MRFLPRNFLTLPNPNLNPIAMNAELLAFNDLYENEDRKICDLLATLICKHLPGAENKIWHRHPVWFIQGNPIVGYSKQKKGWRLMFWSGADFHEPKLQEKGKKFKDASIFYTNSDQIEEEDLRRWLNLAQKIQWDYRMLIKRKGQLLRLQTEASD